MIFFNRTILILLFLVFCTAAFSQVGSNDARDKIQIGLKAGGNYSNVYDSDGDVFIADPKLGFVGGVSLAVPLTKLIGVKPEILFSQKGFHATGQVLGGMYNVTRTTSFIDIPLFISIKPFSFISIVAGPQYSYLFRQKDVFAVGSTSAVQQTEFKNENFRKNLLCFIGGVDINLGHSVLGARMGWDLMNNNGDGTSTTPRYKNMWYQATLGIRIY